MKSALLVGIAFVVGIAASTQTVSNKDKPSKESTMVDNVYQFSELESKRAESNRSYLSFLNVDTMHCGIYTLEAGAVDGQQPHQQDEVYYVQEGEAKIEISGVDHSLSPGSIVFVPAFAEHKFHSITKDLKTLVFFSKVPVENAEQEPGK